MNQALALLEEHAAWTRTGTSGIAQILTRGPTGQMTVAAFETALTKALGVTFTTRPDTAGYKEPVREINGMPFCMIGHFSRRRAQLEARYAQLTREYRHAHGRDPDAAACHKLAQQAALATRPGKKPPRTLDGRRAQWRHELTEAFGPGAVREVMAAVPGPHRAYGPRAPDLQDLAERMVANVSAHRPTWTV